MTLGGLLFQIRRRLRAGVRTSWYREVVRRQIVNASPIRGTTNHEQCEIHILTSSTDWQNACWALRSFYCATGAAYALYIHDDGTLPVSAVGSIKRQFPEAYILEKHQADKEVLPWLGQYPLSYKFRTTNPLAQKVFDSMFYGCAPRILLLDSDVLFFNRPQRLLEIAESSQFRKNCANEDVASAYTVSPVDVERLCGFTLVDRFNSGLCVLQRESLSVAWFEEFLSIPDVMSHPWRVEQTLFALASSRYGCELLPSEYSVSLKPGVEERPCKHYVGAIREWFYSEGIPYLMRVGVLKQKESWHSEANGSGLARLEVKK